MSGTNTTQTIGTTAAAAGQLPVGSGVGQKEELLKSETPQQKAQREKLAADLVKAAAAEKDAKKEFEAAEAAYKAAKTEDEKKALAPKSKAAQEKLHKATQEHTALRDAQIESPQAKEAREVEKAKLEKAAKDAKAELETAETELKNDPANEQKKAALGAAKQKYDTAAKAAGVVATAKGSTGDWIKDKWDKLKGGNLAFGALLGILGYLLAGLFGDGMLGTFASIALPIGLFFMGASNDTMGDFISSAVSGPKRGAPTPPGQEKQRMAGVQPVQMQVQPVARLSNAELVAVLHETQRPGMNQDVVHVVSADGRLGLQALPSGQGADKPVIGTAALRKELDDCRAKSQVSCDLAFMPGGPNGLVPQVVPNLAGGQRARS